MALIRCGGSSKISTANVSSYTLAANATVTSLNLDVSDGECYVLSHSTVQNPSYYDSLDAIFGNGSFIYGNSSYSVSDGKITGPALSSGSTVYVALIKLT